MVPRYESLAILPFQDHRGQLKKLAQKSKLDEGQEIEEIYLLYSNQGAVRGNHYHKRTIEYFIVIAGEALIALSDINKSQIDTIILRDSDNITIKVYPETVHSIKNLSANPLIVLAVSLKEYCPEDTDTFPCTIL